jgi:periplasmic protein TonB
MKEVVAIKPNHILPPGDGRVGPGDWSGGGGGPTNFLPKTALENVPRAKVRIPPEYPAEMRREKMDGEVMVEFFVDARGNVVNAKVRSSTHRAFEEPTIRAVMRWKFEPGISNGIAVPFRMAIPVNFRLGGN